MLVSKKGVSRRGERVTVFSRELCKKIRKRLGITQKDLSNELIAKIITTSNKETAKWIIDNPEGFKVHRDMGYLAVSKFLPRELREDKHDIVEKIKNLDKHEELKKKLLKRYDKEIANVPVLSLLFNKGIMYTHYDYTRFFYCYKFMWFNKRNCSIKKARVYKFDASRLIRSDLREMLTTNKEYDELNFDDFYFRKMKPIE